MKPSVRDVGRVLYYIVHCTSFINHEGCNNFMKTLSFENVSTNVSK